MGSGYWNRQAKSAEGIKGFYGSAQNAPGARSAASLEGNACNVSAMSGVPFRAGAAHVMPLGTIGVAGALDQPVAARHNRI